MILAARGSALQQGSMIDHSHESSTARGGLEMGSKGHENASPEKYQRPLVEHAEPLMGIDEAHRCVGVLRPAGAAALDNVLRARLDRTPRALAAQRRKGR